MVRVRKDGKQCRLVRGCSRPLYAGGCCEPHYRRLQKYGDPKASRPVGGAKLIPAELDAALTRRQREDWTRLGYVKPEKTATGRYNWTASEVRIAVLISRIAKIGIPLPQAADIARATVEGRKRVHLIGDGLALRVEP